MIFGTFLANADKKGKVSVYRRLKGSALASKKAWQPKMVVFYTKVLGTKNEH
jgi:hypothetical protein